MRLEKVLATHEYNAEKSTLLQRQSGPYRLRHAMLCEAVMCAIVCMHIKLNRIANVASITSHA